MGTKRKQGAKALPLLVLLLPLVLASCGPSQEAREADARDEEIEALLNPEPVMTPFVPLVKGASPEPNAPVIEGDEFGLGPAGSAVEALDTLPIKVGISSEVYPPGKFGDGWLDPDVNGCDAWNDTIARDATDYYVDETDEKNCRIIFGQLDDPYTALRVDFDLQDRTAPVVDVDHLVGLVDAWQKGAQDLTQKERESLANDSLNLLAVYGPAAEKKDGRDAAEWLPPNEDFICQYASLQVAVKYKYNLWVDPEEYDVLYDILGRGCDDMYLLTQGGSKWPVSTEGRAPNLNVEEEKHSAEEQGEEVEPEIVVPEVPPPADGGLAYFGSCSEARANGYAPLYVGNPGYRPGLDRDGDGTACES